MAVEVAALALKIERDRTAWEQAKKGLNDIDKGGQRAGKSALSMATALKAAVTGAVAAAVVRLGKSVFDLGSGLAETANKFNTVFGDARGTVTAFGNEFARMAGLSIGQFQEMAATTGAVVQGMGYAEDAAAKFSNEVLKLSGDIASFNNLQTADVVHRITTALTGERDSLKQLGIVVLESEVQHRALQMRMAGVTGALTQQEKAAATLALVTERAGRAIGDLERTQHSTANTAKQLGADVRTIAERLAAAAVGGDDFASALRGVEREAQAVARWLEKNQSALAAWVRVVTTSFKVGVDTVALMGSAIINTFKGIGDAIGKFAAAMVITFQQIVQGADDTWKAVVNALTGHGFHLNLKGRIAAVTSAWGDFAGAGKKAADDINTRLVNLAQSVLGLGNAIGVAMAGGLAGSGAGGGRATMGGNVAGGRGGGRAGVQAVAASGRSGFGMRGGTLMSFDQLPPPDFDPLMDGWVAALQDAVERASATIQQGITQTIGDALYNGFAAAFSGEGLGAAIKAFGQTILAGLGALFVDLGKQLIAYGVVMSKLMPFLLNIFTSGPAALAAGAALVALGSAFSSIASGAGRGTAQAGAFREPRVAPIEDATTRQVTFGTSSGQLATAGGPLIGNLTIIGPDDPRVQRDLMRLIGKARARGIHD